MASFKLLPFICIFSTLLYISIAKPTTSGEIDLAVMESSEEGFDESLIEPRLKKDGTDDEGSQNLELGKLFQGDMKLEPEQLAAMVRNATEQSKVESRTGLLSETYRWPKNSKRKVVVPFKTEGFSKY